MQKQKSSCNLHCETCTYFALNLTAFSGWYEAAGFAKEFQIEFREDELLLTNRDLITLEFRRVDDTKFPIDAIQDLQQSR